MRIQEFTPILCSIAFLAVSCGRPNQESIPGSSAPAPVPEAFQEGSVSKSLDEIKSRSYGSGAVEKLIAEALEKDTALAHLLARWEATAPAYAKHLEPFKAFDLNNTDYYDDAVRMATTLADSTLGQGIAQRIGSSKGHYAEVVVPFRNNIAHHNAITEQGDDLITLITLEQTLGMVEDYQHENMPDRKLLEADLVALTALRDELRTKLKP